MKMTPLPARKVPAVGSLYVRVGASCQPIFQSVCIRVGASCQPIFQSLCVRVGASCQPIFQSVMVCSAVLKLTPIFMIGVLSSA